MSTQLEMASSSVTASRLKSIQAQYNEEYLEALKSDAKIYTTPNSLSQVTVFSVRLPGVPRVDSFLIAKAARFHLKDRKFHVPCQLKIRGPGEPSIYDLGSFMARTGPKHVIEDAVVFGPDVGTAAPTRNHTILVRREGETNIYHCLLEIMTMTMAMDVLRGTIEASTNQPYFGDDDIANTQVVILDERKDGKLFSLWSLFAGKPTIRAKAICQPIRTNIIVPLAGGTNPLWTMMPEVQNLEPGSTLLRSFVHRVLDHYNISQDVKHEGPVIVTYVRRKWRKVLREEVYLEALQSLLGSRIQLQVVDLAVLSFRAQLQLIRRTEVLIGVHGAALTHAMFMNEESSVAEIFPAEGGGNKSFRNLCVLKGHSYFHTIASRNVDLDEATRSGLRADPDCAIQEYERDNDGKVDWHYQDVDIEQERWMELCTTAIMAMYNKGGRHFDVAPLRNS